MNWGRCWVAVCLLCYASVCYGTQQRWYFVRHFEKLPGENPGLTVKGQLRAEALARYFTHIPITKIYSTDYLRTRQSAQPLADILGMEIEYYSPARLADFASTLGASNRVVVVGHSNTTPELVRLMGGEAKAMNEKDFGRLYILSKNDLGMHTQSVIMPFGHY
ncbi:MAG: broad specificity phosphatase PhoE [Paraglaciecola sp.]